MPFTCPFSFQRKEIEVRKRRKQRKKKGKERKRKERSRKVMNKVIGMRVMR